MTNFTGASRNRESRPQTTRASARRMVHNRDVAVSPLRNAQTEAGNRGLRGGGSRPEGGRR